MYLHRRPSGPRWAKRSEVRFLEASRMSIFTGSAEEKTSKGDGTGTFEVLEANNYDARLVAIIDLGIQDNFGKARRTVLFVWEVVEEGVAKADGKPWYLTKKYNLSFNPESALRLDLERWRRKAYKFADPIDVKKFLGQPWDVEVSNKPSTDGTKTYYDVAKVGPVKKGREADVGPPVVTPFYWEFGQDATELNNALGSWVPRVYGQKVVDLIQAGQRALGLAGKGGGGDGTNGRSATGVREEELEEHQRGGGRGGAPAEEEIPF